MLHEYLSPKGRFLDEGIETRGRRRLATWLISPRAAVHKFGNVFSRARAQRSGVVIGSFDHIRRLRLRARARYVAVFVPECTKGGLVSSRRPSRRGLRKRPLLRASGNLFRCNAFPAHAEEAPAEQPRSLRAVSKDSQAPSRSVRSRQDAP